MKTRSVAAVIILSLITCGIYALYWVYTTANELEAEGQTGGMSPALLLILTIFISPVGFALYGNYVDDNLNAIRSRRGMPTVDNKVVYIILGIFVWIVLVGLVQNDINKIVENNKMYN